ncbi:MAG TPA: hypothetical protein VFH38_09475 [Jatrophihabitans sp.]|nr:hypothetical protein [Jatrophihabitans sp.]
MAEPLVPEGRMRRVLLEAAISAAAAPSVYNAQPWRLLLRPDRLEVHADPGQMVYRADPVGRQLHISCGCAVFNAVIAVAAQGAAPQVCTLPRPDRPRLLAAIAPAPAGEADPIGALREWVPRRQTPREPLEAEQVDAATARLLRRAARAEGAVLDAVGAETRAAVADLHDRAVRSEPQLGSNELPRAPSGAGSAAQHSGLFVLSTPGDDRASWLAAGRALERVLLELTARGMTAVPMMQAIECVPVRAELADLLPGQRFPQLLLRVGRAPQRPPVHRRRLVDVLVHGAEWDSGSVQDRAATGC